MSEQVAAMDWGRSLHREIRPFRIAKEEIDRLQAILQSSLQLATVVQNAALTGRV